MSSVAKRYASAFLDVARETGSLDAVGKDLHELERLLSTSAEFRTFVAHPLISPAEQQAVVDRVFGQAAFPLTANLFQLLIRRERLALLPDIVRLGLELWEVEKGILKVAVTAASELETSQQTQLTAKLADRTGKEIKLLSSVDESLIGGFRLRIGDQVEDHSLAAKLKTFKRNVINA